MSAMKSQRTLRWQSVNRQSFQSLLRFFLGGCLHEIFSYPSPGCCSVQRTLCPQAKTKSNSNEEWIKDKGQRCSIVSGTHHAHYLCRISWRKLNAYTVTGDGQLLDQNSVFCPSQISLVSIHCTGGMEFSPGLGRETLHTVIILGLHNSWLTTNEQLQSFPLISFLNATYCRTSTTFCPFKKSAHFWVLLRLDHI